MNAPDISCDVAPDVIVVGAGVLGSATAAELGASGLSVTVVDPGGDNASSIAAGMIAPAMESVLDGADAGRAALLRRAAARWPDFARRFGLALSDDASEWRGPDPEGFLARLRALGFAGERRGETVVLSGERRVSPAEALASLAAAPRVTRVRGDAIRAERIADGWRLITEAGAVVAPHLVLATGAAPPLPGLPPPVATIVDRIVPIRGQLLRLPGSGDHIVRDAAGYVAPLGGDLAIGATMEPGRRDLPPDAATADAQRAWSRTRLGLDVESGRPRVGVRGASPDGLPLAGPVGDNLHLALAPRRNGWLLAPLVAAAVSAGLRDHSPPEPALDPLR